MIVDSSAVIAVLRQEHDALDISLALQAAPRPRMAAPTLLECSIVAGRERHRDVDRFVADAGIDVVAFDLDLAHAAREAHARYGRGSGSPARLNFGDCIAYALAVSTGEPLLFKGQDFTHTDVVPAI